MTAQERDCLITSYLEHVAGLLRKYAASARFDVDDLQQEATIVIMRCLAKKPEEVSQLHGYVYVSVRNRMIDLIRYRQRRERRHAGSLDAPITSDSTITLLDLLPSRSALDPIDLLLIKEQLQARAGGRVAR